MMISLRVLPPAVFAAPRFVAHRELRARRAVVVVDMVESVRLIAADEDDTVRRWQQFIEEVSVQLLPPLGGRLVKSLGDGLLCDFLSAAPAIDCALKMQEAAHRLSQGYPTDRRIQLRIGAHAADVIVDDLDIYGSGVNLAARLMTLARPGEIVVSAEVRDELIPGLDAEVEDLGDCYLKHLAGPVRAYRIGHAQPDATGEWSQAWLRPMRPTVAVVPWASRVDEPAQHGIGDLLADEVIGSLSRSAELYVLSRLSTAIFRQRRDALGDIRRLLGAGYVVTGTYHATGRQLRVSLEVTETATAQVVCAESLRGATAELVSGQSSLVARIVQGVSGSILRRQLELARSVPLASLEGYTLLLAAVSLVHSSAPADFERARTILECLIERYPRHPIPHAWLAKWHVLRVTQSWSQDIKREASLALVQTRTALDNDGYCSLALAVDGFVHCLLRKDFAAASQSYERALEVNPNEPLAWLFKGAMHAYLGEGNEAMHAAEMALALSPLDPVRYFFESLAAAAAAAAGRYERTLALAKRSLRVNRNFASTWRALAIAQVRLGQIDAAKETAKVLLALEPALTVAAYLKHHPSAEYPIGKVWAESLRAAGVPES
jgi:class 3 adenylate cyclase/TolB-like protein